MYLLRSIEIKLRKYNNHLEFWGITPLLYYGMVIVRVRDEETRWSR